MNIAIWLGDDSLSRLKSRGQRCNISADEQCPKGARYSVDEVATDLKTLRLKEEPRDVVDSWLGVGAQMLSSCISDSGQLCWFQGFVLWPKGQIATEESIYMCILR